MLSFLFLVLSADWQITETEVFQPLQLNEVLVSSDGHAYILNFQEAHVRYYAPDGKLIGLIGRKGKGPGEFTYPTQFFLDDRCLYVFDLLNTSMSVFSADGQFIKRLRAPQRGLQFQKVKGGWFYGNWNVFGIVGPAELTWVDDDFLNPKTILTIDELGIDGGLRVRSDDNRTVAQYGPISAKPTMVSSPDQSLIYLTDAMLFDIKIIDVEKKSVIGNIIREEKRLPFDTDWADEQFKRYEDDPDMRLPAKVDKLYPETFPIIREIIVTPDHTLVINRWRGRPDAAPHPIALDPKGKTVPMPYSWEVLERLAGIVDPWAYVLAFDSEAEEAGLARCPVTNLEEFVEKHPIEFDGQGGRSISISD